MLCGPILPSLGGSGMAVLTLLDVSSNALTGSIPAMLA
jgi:hypothetical protein